jgi:hypothetical protein
MVRPRWKGGVNSRFLTSVANHEIEHINGDRYIPSGIRPITQGGHLIQEGSDTIDINTETVIILIKLAIYLYGEAKMKGRRKHIMTDGHYTFNLFLAFSQAICLHFRGIVTSIESIVICSDRYIPSGIRPITQGGHLIQEGSDTIDINTETVDGKNDRCRTF